METDVIASAVELSEAIRGAGRQHSFDKTVAGFVQLLATVPDYPATEFSQDGIGTLKATAEAVIISIEARIEKGEGSATDERHMAEGVYEIRRLLEEIDRWRRHYLQP